jgi:hypothetical protein
MASNSFKCWTEEPQLEIFNYSFQHYERDGAEEKPTLATKIQNRWPESHPRLARVLATIRGCAFDIPAHERHYAKNDQAIYGHSAGNHPRLGAVVSYFTLENALRLYNDPNAGGDTPWGMAPIDKIIHVILAWANIVNDGLLGGLHAPVSIRKCHRELGRVAELVEAFTRYEEATKDEIELHVFQSGNLNAIQFLTSDQRAPQVCYYHMLAYRLQTHLQETHPGLTDFCPPGGVPTG